MDSAKCKDGQHATPDQGEIFALPPVDLDELALSICVALDDARAAGALFAQGLRAGRSQLDVAHLVALARQLADVAVAHSRQSVGVRALALQVDREGLWAAIRDNFAKGAELELMKAPK